MRSSARCLPLALGALALALTQGGCEVAAPAARAAASPAPQAGGPVLGLAPDTLIPAGLELRVRLREGLSTSASRAGDRFTATLQEPVITRGRTALPRGTVVSGVVRQCAASRRLRGRAVLAFAVDRVELEGRVYQLSTAPIVRNSAQQAGAGRGDVAVPAGTTLTFRMNRNGAVRAPAAQVAS